jgi:hypothetical protein
MALDLELELLRAAYVLVARNRVDAFRIDELLESVRGWGPTTRLASPLLAHLVRALAESLLQAGLLERVGADDFAVTPRAIAELEREPRYLADDLSHPRSPALQLRGTR